jgi:hypothetical protein
MSEGRGSASAFRDQFAVEPIGDGGVLIDLLTGSFFHLNATATRACLALQESRSGAEAVTHLAASMTLPLDEASSLLESVRAQLGEPGVRTEPIGPFRYRRHETGYALEERDRLILTMDHNGRTLRLHVRPDTLSFKMLDYIRAITPKLLHLRGVTVLHASACVLPEGLTAFAGRSGAGKTTTARAFEAAGAHLISEDLVVLGRDSETAVVTGGEERAHAWAAATAAAMSDRGVPDLDCGGLADVVEAGPTIPLRSIWFVDNARRQGDALERRPFTAVEGTLALLENNFLGSDGAERWREHVRSTHAIASRLTLWEVTPPDGLDRLAAAARAYATKTAS